MFRKKIPARQLSAWLFAGMTPVLLQLLGGSSWVGVMIAGSLGLLMSAWIWSAGWEPKRWQIPLLLIYIIIVLGTLLRRCDESWPIGNRYPAVPLIVLALAAWSAQKGLSAAARVGTVLFWAVLLMYLVVLGAGIGNVELQWLKPQPSMPDAEGVLVLLIPSAAVCMLREGEKWSLRITLPVIFSVVAAVITAGVLSPAVASGMEGAFYEMTRSISLGGVAKRFEALISAGMTVGWFALTNLLLSMCGLLLQQLIPGWGRTGVWMVAIFAAAWMLCGLHIPSWILLSFGGLCWVALSILTQGLEKRKKSKKSENNA